MFESHKKIKMQEALDQSFNGTLDVLDKKIKKREANLEIVALEHLKLKKREAAMKAKVAKIAAEVAAMKAEVAECKENLYLGTADVPDKKMKQQEAIVAKNAAEAAAMKAKVGKKAAKSAARRLWAYLQQEGIYNI